MKQTALPSAPTLYPALDGAVAEGAEPLNPSYRLQEISTLKKRLEDE